MGYIELSASFFVVLLYTVFYTHVIILCDERWFVLNCIDTMIADIVRLIIIIGNMHAWVINFTSRYRSID